MDVDNLPGFETLGRQHHRGTIVLLRSTIDHGS